MRKLILVQSGETIGIQLNINGRNYSIFMDADEAAHIAHRLQSFASSGHNNAETVLIEGEYE